MKIDYLQRPQVPMWVRRLIDQPDSSRRWQMHGLLASTLEQGPFSLTEIVLPNARALDAEPFQDQVQQAYELALQALKACRASHAVRWWNFVPGIGRHASEGLDWYMLFNAGRHAAMRRCFGTSDFGQQLATASAVGSHGDDFVLHVLGSVHPGSPLENPRQIPAYNYSNAYGPLPPCFARATGLGHVEHQAMRGALLIGGTASIVGEATQHLGDLNGQIQETICNMTHLLAAGCGLRDADKQVLACVDELRVYVVRPADRNQIVTSLAARLPGLKRMEVLEAELCRPALLVEVEGVTQPGVLAKRDSHASGHRLVSA